MQVEIYGGSDDLIEVRVNGKDFEEFNANTGGSLYMGTVLVTSLGGAYGVKVHAIYDGCWSFAIGQLDEGRTQPRKWQYLLDQEHEYSTRVIIMTDEDVVVAFAKEKE